MVCKTSIGRSLGQKILVWDFSVQPLWTCLDFVDTLKDPDDTFGQGGVHVTEAKTVHA